jgi:hypothetical protein
MTAKIEKVTLEKWLDVIKDSHTQAAASATATAPAGCCLVQNQQTGGVYQIPTDAGTCQAIGGIFTPGPC